MKCRDIEPLIYLVREGELTEQEKGIVSEHIQNCARCRDLARSVNAMASVVLKAEYDQEIKVTDELIMPRLLQNPTKHAVSYNFIIVKAVAACVLLILASVFISQERSFNRDRTDLQARLQQEDSGLTDCIRELRRKIHYHSITAFARPDSVPVNLINEETLTAYVRENCGYNATDIKALKKLLIQAGLSD